eukprot:TRINITY_DN2149_c0_g1_i9.p2 TRINITY_DN2149_c0_g1~~TRINITY_DN2149_c0_g1_i9.p2  ORF type:complete len:1025 (+),score=167.76 TRINITY_DN2149_c0_g1_i9:246-3320(+)
MREQITVNNMQMLLSMSLQQEENLLAALHSQLRTLFAGVSKSQKKADPAILKLIEDLTAGLDGTFSSGMGNNLDEKDFSHLLRITDEFEFWAHVEAAGQSNSQMFRGQKYLEYYQEIIGSWRDSETMQLGSFIELLDKTMDILDQVWSYDHGGQHYHEPRMKRLLEVIGSAMISRGSREMQNDIWSAGGTAKLRLNEIQRMGKMWVEKVSKTVRMWGGKWNAWEDQSIKEFNQRIEEISLLRNQFDELSKVQQMFGGRITMDIPSVFTPLMQINVFQVSKFNEQQFQSAKGLFAKNMEPIENQICELLKVEIFQKAFGSGGRTGYVSALQILKDMTKWTGLLSRPNVMKNLTRERDQVLDGLLQSAIKTKEEFDSRCGLNLDLQAGENIPNGHNFSQVVNSIIWARQLNQKMKRMHKGGQFFLKDLQKFKKLEALVNEAVNAMKEFEEEQFESWKEEVMEVLKKPENDLVLQLTGKLMELDMKDGLLKVNYSERLVQLLREFRQLTEFGYQKQIPKQIQECVKTGKKFYKEALTLKQIANFYNSMSTQIIPSQKQMIVEQAIQFEEVVKNITLGQGKRGMMMNNQQTLGQISWSNSKDLEDYIQRIQNAANNIMNENRRLRKIHMNLIDILAQLFKVDLVKQKDLWNDKMERIRRMIEQGTAGRDQNLCRIWKVHWDYQLYKALETQYQKGLLSLNQNLSEISADLIVQGKTIIFRPPLEELKLRYYKEIKQFVNYPAKHFLGVGGTQEIYKLMPEKNHQFLSIVYIKAEELFKKLQDIIIQFRPWVAVAYIDISNIEEKLKTLEDWDYNIRNLRFKRKELDKLQEQFKVDCFTIYATQFKNQVDDMLQRILDNLTNSLRNSLKGDIESIENFITKALEKLQQKPKTMDEIQQCQEEYYKLKTEQKEMLLKIKAAEEKNKIIRNLSGYSHDIAGVQARWDNFEIAILDFDNILKEQHEQIKEDVSKRVIEISQETEKFYARWTALKPKKMEEIDRESAKEIAQNMKEWRSQWSAVEEKNTIGQQ